MIVGANVIEVASAISTLLDDTKKRIEMGSAGRTWVEQSFSGDAVVNRYVDLYRRIMDQ